MSTVICGNQFCQFRGKEAGVCQKDFIFLNAGTGCDQWFNRDGMQYQVPKYSWYGPDPKNPSSEDLSEEKAEKEDENVTEKDEETN